MFFFSLFHRKIWTREWLRDRTLFGAYYTLLAELRNLDISGYRNFLRMDVKSFEELLQLVAPIITRQDTNMKSTIPPGQRLALTHSLSSEFCCNLYQSFVSHVTTIFEILRSYIVQARKSLEQIDQSTGVIKTPVQLCCFQLFGRPVDISTKHRDTKRLVEAVQQAATC